MNRILEECAWRALFDRPERVCILSADAPISIESFTNTFASMSNLMGAALADHALNLVCGEQKYTSVSHDVKSAYLYNKINRTRQLEAVASLNAWGCEFVVMKGLASAHQFFEDPNLRTTGDIDILVRDEEMLNACIKHLADIGYEFNREFPLPPWGFPSAISFLPMVSPDQIVNIDFHLEADSYPLPLGLSVADVFESANTLDVDGVSLKVPMPEHHYLIALSNAARERFGPTTCRSIIDAGRLMTQNKDLDWSEIASRTEKAGMSKAHRTFCQILSILGAEIHCEAGRTPSSCPRAESLAYRLLGFTQVDHSNMQKTFIELRDCYDFAQWLNIWLSRIKGVVSPKSGVPEV